jgi:predicted nucleic acid-binding protein
VERVQAIVVTGNRRHYERIPGVTVENWIRD